MMILKFQLNMRLDKDQNMSVSSEIIADDESEAEKAGEDFFYLMRGFIAGYGRANPDAQESS